MPWIKFTIEMDYRRSPTEHDDPYDDYDHIKTTSKTQVDSDNLTAVKSLKNDVYFNYETAYDGFAMGPNPSSSGIPTKFLGVSPWMTMRNRVVLTVFFRMLS